MQSNNFIYDQNLETVVVVDEFDQITKCAVALHALHHLRDALRIPDDVFEVTVQKTETLSKRARGDVQMQDKPDEFVLEEENPDVVFVEVPGHDAVFSIRVVDDRRKNDQVHGDDAGGVLGDADRDVVVVRG